MPTAQQLIEVVERKVQDAAFTPEIILDILNRGILEVAGWKNTDPRLGLHGEILLPDLETVDSEDTEEGLAHIDLPDDYMKNLYMVTQPGGSEISIHTSLRQLLALWNGTLANSGALVRDVSVVGDQLYYQPIPTDPLTLYFYYYRRPATLTMEDSGGLTNVPSCIPDQFQMDLLVNYAAKEIFDEIEDGIDGQKVQTASYAGKYQAALTALYKSIAHKSQQRLARRREKSFF